MAVPEGIFNVLVGSATVGGVPENTFNPTDVFLSVQVDGEELLPRRPVAAVPYAMRSDQADDADSLDGQDSSAFAQSSDLAAAIDRIAALEALLASVSLNGNDITFSGVNVHVNNGTGTTSGAVNGLGNLIVGHNEARFGGGDDRSGSHNIVVGGGHNFTSYGGLVAGYGNTISGPCATVSGGAANTASGMYSSVSGGKDRSVDGLNDWRAGSLFEGY